MCNYSYILPTLSALLADAPTACALPVLFSLISTMKTTEIQASFATLLETFEPIIGQPTDEDLTWLEFSALGVLAPISFDEELGKHNLMSLLLSSNNYKSHHNGLTFPDYETRPAIYENNIAADASAGVRAKAEAKHQAKLNNWRIFNCARQGRDSDGGDGTTRHTGPNPDQRAQG